MAQKKDTKRTNQIAEKGRQAAFVCQTSVTESTGMNVTKMGDVITENEVENSEAIDGKITESETEIGRESRASV
ncbi:hypothetical protein K7X08_006889 [Anisodus acutangulus]|uniref:Uncharacterized protein n=1 Tax=Anisodus acutangulus TaxID=402998 RepID=A0A9Q1LBK8_9SOLA|nr:hypothetical protein K7X08_006889 [Anisodus acutangulus]